MRSTRYKTSKTQRLVILTITWLLAFTLALATLGILTNTEKGVAPTPQSTALYDAESGNGDSAETAYIISTEEHLTALATAVNSGTTYSGKYFKLKNDITITSDTWTPIGVYIWYNSKWTYFYFSGNFNGCGFTVHFTSRIHMQFDYYSSVGENHNGLFGSINGTVENLCVIWDDLIITSDGSCMGGIVGYNNGGTIQNCYSEVYISNINLSRHTPISFGGIVGSSSTTVKNCYCKFQMGTIVSSSSLSVNQSNNMKDNFAYNASSSIDLTIGGIVASGKAENCYTYGSMDFSVTNYDSLNVGAICAYSSRATNCYSIENMIDSNVNYGDYGSAGDNGTIRTDLEMKDSSNFGGFDFTNTWGIDPSINGGYPYLQGFNYGTTPNTLFLTLSFNMASGNGIVIYIVNTVTNEIQQYYVVSNTTINIDFEKNDEAYTLYVKMPYTWTMEKLATSTLETTEVDGLYTFTPTADGLTLNLSLTGGSAINHWVVV